MRLGSKMFEDFFLLYLFNESMLCSVKFQTLTSDVICDR